MSASIVKAEECRSNYLLQKVYDHFLRIRKALKDSLQEHPNYRRDIEVVVPSYSGRPFIATIIFEGSLSMLATHDKQNNCIIAAVDHANIGQYYLSMELALARNILAAIAGVLCNDESGFTLEYGPDFAADEDTQPAGGVA